MPFTVSDFFDVLAAYNTTLWPGALALWLASLALVLLVARAATVPHRAIHALLAVHWAWSAIAYHAAFFTRINPAAWLFALLFLAEAMLFLWLGVVHERFEFSTGRSTRHLAGAALIAYGLVYPVITFAEGMTFPAVPTFGLPCPTTIFTIGWLLTTERPPWSVVAVPVVWSVIGGSAALFFGVYADLMLPVAGILLVAHRLRGVSYTSAAL